MRALPRRPDGAAAVDRVAAPAGRAVQVDRQAKVEDRAAEVAADVNR